MDSLAKAKCDGFRKGAISTTTKNHHRNTLVSCVSSNVGSTEWKAHLKNAILVSGSATPPPCRLCQTGCPPSPSLPKRSNAVQFAVNVPVHGGNLSPSEWVSSAAIVKILLSLATPYDTSFGTLEQPYHRRWRWGPDRQVGELPDGTGNVSCVSDSQREAVWEFVPTETESHPLSAIKSTAILV